mgnify:CR=1 FL=1
MMLQPTIEEFTALQQALQASLSQQETLASQREKLTSELRFVRHERDLLKERLDKMMRKVFAAKSEARGTEQKDMFFNEAEALAALGVAGFVFLMSGVVGYHAVREIITPHAAPAWWTV